MFQKQILGFGNNFNFEKDIETESKTKPKHDRFDFVGMIKKAREKGQEADLITNMIKYRFQRGYSSLILVIGARGCGKSSTCFRLSEIVNQKLNPLREKMDLEKKEHGTLVTSHIELLKFVKDAKMGDDCILEEISVLYPSRRSQAEESVSVGKILDIIRKKRLIIYANCPMQLSADKTLRTSANALILCFKVIKKENVVVQKFWKMQPNFLMGKVYTHRFVREDGTDAEYMFTEMPDLKLWENYEKEKDNFIDDQYTKLLRKAEIKKEREEKELGYRIELKKALTPLQEKILELMNNGITNQRIIGEKLGKHQEQICRNIKFMRNKGALPKKELIIAPNNNIRNPFTQIIKV